MSGTEEIEGRKLVPSTYLHVSCTNGQEESSFVQLQLCKFSLHHGTWTGRLAALSEQLHAERPSQTWLNSFSDDIAVPARGQFNNQGGFLSHLTGPLRG